MSLKINRQNIAYVHSDALVYPADPYPDVIGGASFDVFKKGSDQLLEARREIGYIPHGEVRYSEAYSLHAKYVFHAAGPVYGTGCAQEVEMLRNCYRTSMKMAHELGCESIAFPLISSGTFGWPKRDAFLIAKDTILTDPYFDELAVTLCIYDDETVKVAEELKEDITDYLSDHQVFANEMMSCDSMPMPSASQGRRPSRPSVKAPRVNLRKMLQIKESRMEAESLEDTLRERLSKSGEDFRTRLFRLIDERGLTDPEVYKKANIDRKLFSKIRSNDDYHPKKDTVIALCFALKLNIDETKDLMKRAEYAFSPARQRDLILQYCIEHELYDLMQVNEVLYSFHENCL